MTPNEALHLFVAIKLHFTTTYDAFKYNFKVKKLDFTKRKDKWQFNKLARQPDPRGLILSNLCINPRMWVGQLFEQQAKERYWEWKKFQESQTYIFKEQLKLIKPSGFRAQPHEHPLVLQLFLAKKISLDTLTILNEFIGFTSTWTIDDPTWVKVKGQILKYRPFISFDKQKTKQILKEWLDIHSSDK